MSRCRASLLSATLGLLLITAGPAWAATLIVDSAADNEISGDGACTLREAINNANDNAQTTGGDCTAGSGTDTITFNIAGASPIEIELTTALIITDPVVIDGTTQPGNTGACTMPIPNRPTYGLSLLGSGITGSGADTAIRLSADGSTIRGFNLQGFGFANFILRTDNSLIECNFIGPTADGSSVAAVFDPGSWGFALQQASSGNTIQKNLISGLGLGIRFQAGHTNNKIYDNFIGTNRAGTAALPNNQGLVINGDNELGASGKGNLISGNANVGILVTGAGTVVYANLIGTDVTGTAAVPNGAGISLAGSDNFIGSNNANVRNVISGNTGVGVAITGGGNEVIGNYIGTDITGSAAVPNGSHGVTIAGGSDNFIGFGGGDNGNLISGNVGDGVSISGHNADNTRVFSNSIGTNADVTAAIPNGGNGVSILNADGGATELLNVNIGNTRTTHSNVISGNAGHGIYVHDSNANRSTQVFILGNRIGTDRTDTLDLGNGLDGIHVLDNIEGSRIGQFQPGPTFTNTIAFNDGNGITIAGSSSQGNNIDQNYIFDNDGLGIDLGGDGVTPNDTGDGDNGPNRRQNFPELVSASMDCAGELTVEYSLSSSLATVNSSNNHAIEFFRADADGTEGAFALASAGYKNYPNVISATLGIGPDLGVSFGDRLIATATNHLSDTSEFSASIPITSTCVFEVTTTDNAGAGSLRQAILDANSFAGGGSIHFNIAGTGPHVISPLTALPPITGPMIIDGTSQTGNSVCSTDLAARPAYQIIVDGTAGGRPNLLTLAPGSEGSTVQGLNLRNGNAAIVALSGGHSILCNLIGTDETGVTAQGNTIGVTLSSSDNTVGGLIAGQSNAIAWNGTGIRAASGASNTFRGNSFFQNSGLAIDLGSDGGTANDAGDADTGANLLQNSPELSQGLIVDTEAQISFTVDSDPLAQAYPITVDFFTPDADDEEAQTWLFSDTFESGDYPGDTVITVTAATFGLTAGDRLVALATDADGNSSEISASLTLMAAGCLNVTTTADSGTGSLREAITCANATPELDTITFAIPGAGPHVISTSDELPAITAPVIIDGTTQSGNGTLCATSIPNRGTYQVVIEDGSFDSFGLRLDAGSDGSTLRGLNIRGFDDDLIAVRNSSGHTIACNFLGTDASGTTQAAGNGNGVGIRSGNHVTVGGTGATQGNLIATSSSGTYGVSLATGGSGNTVQHNFIGTDKTGAAALPNEFGVFFFTQNPATQVDLAILDNLISGNSFAGVFLDDVDGLEMKRNLIGTDLSGTQPLGNDLHGIWAGAFNSTDGLTIGGTGTQDGNTIAFNGGDGILVSNSQAAILGNNIFSNTESGIDLGDDGPTSNDAGDGDSGANNLQNFPVLVAAPTLDGGDLKISYSVDSTTANSTYPLRVEFFMADAAGEEGMTYLGFDEYTASDYSGCGAAPCVKEASVSLIGGISVSDTVLATATDADGNTSEFSSGVTAVVGCLTVTTAADSGTGSLREAIACANAESGLDTITFAIPGAGPHVITLASNLPALSDPVIIDGASQPGNAGVCTEAIPDRPDYQIVIDGDGVATRALILVGGSKGSTIQGLNIRGFTSFGIGASGPGDGLSTFRCNFIGTDETGLAAAANERGIVIIGLEDMTIGGSDPGDGNLLSGNTRRGIDFTLQDSQREIVLGNFVGTDKTGAAPLGNGGAGINIGNTVGTVMIGGIAPGEGNVIAFNAVGIEDSSSGSAINVVAHTIRGNRIFSNIGLGIDLGDDGVTANDAGDGDSGANKLQNTPHLLDATSVDGVLSIGYLVDSSSDNSTYPLSIDFYLADGDGEEGSEPVASATYTSSDARQAARVSFPNAGSIISGDLLVATATDAEGNTSEFSAPAEVNAYLVSTMADGEIGSLRQAITNANAAAGASWITFGLTGDGPHVITPATDLPAFTQPVILDGSTQAGNSVCTDATADRGAYQIVLHGDADTDALLGDGIVIEAGASGSTIKGLNIRNFSGSGILLDASPDNIILCNFIGTDEEGATAMGNGVGIFVAGSNDSQIGGSEDGDGNLISGHVSGIDAFPGTGVLLAAGNINNTRIQGNAFGTDKAGAGESGTGDLGNGVGVLTDASGTTVFNTFVGGQRDGDGNIFAWNGEGVVVGSGVPEVTIEGNSFYANDGLGIDLQVGGIVGRTLNDAGDADTGSNGGQNFPVLTADASTGNLMVTFRVDSETTNSNYPLGVEFFLADTSGTQSGTQGETLIGTAQYLAGDYDGCGAPPCDVVVDLGPVNDLEITAGMQLVSTATDSGGNTSEFSDPAAVTGLVDLAVSIVESADPVIAGSGAGNLNYTVVVTNLSPVEATGIELQNTLTLPSGVTLVFQVPSAGSFSGDTWTLGTLPAGANAMLSIRATVEPSAAAGSAVTNAVVTAVNEVDTNASNNTAIESTSITRQVDLAVSVSESIDPAVAGSGAGNLVYNVAVTNSGPSAASGLVIANALTLPNGVEVVSQIPTAGLFSDTPPSSGTWTLDTLPAGGIETLFVTLTVGASTTAGTDTITNTASITAVNETDSNTSNNAAAESTSVTRQLDLSVAMAESIDPVLAGSGLGNLVYTATVTNHGPADASGVALDNTLTLPAGVTVESRVPSAGSFSGSTWTLGTLASGDSATLTVTLTASASAAPGTDVITSAIAVTAVHEADTDAVNDTASESTSITREVDLVAAVSFDSIDPVVAGSGPGNLVYEVLVANTGPSIATAVAVENVVTLPAGVTIVSQVPTRGSISGTTWTMDALPVSAAETLRITMTVDSSALVGSDTISTSAAITALNETDTNTSNNTASESTSIARRVDLSVTVSESVDPVVAGSSAGNLIYTVEVANDGPSDATGVEVSNILTLPTGVTTESQVPSAGSFTDTSWALGALPSGASETLTVTLTAAAAATAGTDTITDAAAITAVNETDTDDTNDSASESTSISRDHDLAIAIDPGGLTAVVLGGTLNYELTASNVGDSNATDLVLEATVPEHTTFDVASTPDSWQCVPDTGADSVCTLELGDLDSGSSTSAAFVVVADSAIARDVSEIILTASVDSDSGKVDVNPADNTDEFSIDVDLPPIVQGLDTVASTFDGQLRDGEAVRLPVTQILVEFSEEVIGAEAAASFLLIEAGLDGVVSSSCLGAQGDDQAIIVESTIYDESALYAGPTSRLELGSGLPLQRGRYRVFACANDIEDASGQLLDGDIDGAVGGDFSLGFVVGESSLLENPNFDQALAPWSSLDFAWDDEDVDTAPSSGSAAVLPVMTAVLTHPCIEVTTIEEGLFSSMSALVQDPGGAVPSVQLELDFYTEGDCQGTSLGFESMSRVEGATGSQWFEPSVWRAIPETAVSARPSLRYESSDASSAALIDRLSLIPMLFGDGFESGDTGAWSAVAP